VSIDYAVEVEENVKWELEGEHGVVLGHFLFE
jgi:hypothetical protein